MRTTFLLTLILASFWARPLLVQGDDASEIHRTLQAFGVEVKLDIVNVRGQDYFGVIFSRPYSANDTIHAYCLSPNRDFTFELVNSLGKVIPVDPDFSKKVSAPAVITHIYQEERRGCAAVPESSKNVGFALIEVYPKVPKGSYTLHISFKPPGVAGPPAEFDPIPIVVVEDNLI